MPLDREVLLGIDARVHRDEPILERVTNMDMIRYLRDRGFNHTETSDSGIVQYVHPTVMDNDGDEEYRFGMGILPRRDPANVLDFMGMVQRFYGLNKEAKPTQLQILDELLDRDKKEPSYQFVPSKNKGDPVIEPVEGYEGVVSHLLIHHRGDTLYFRDVSHGKNGIFEITDHRYSESNRNGLPSHDRLRAFTDRDLEVLNKCTLIPYSELREMRNLERSIKDLDEIRPKKE